MVLHNLCTIFHVKNVLFECKGFRCQAGRREYCDVGDRDCGGDSSSVQTKLKAVDTVYSNKTAFVAKLTDGSVVTRGFVGDGGDSSSV